MDVNALTRRIFLAVSVCGGRAAMARTIQIFGLRKAGRTVLL